MTQTMIAEQIERFSAQMMRLRALGWQCEELCSHGFRLQPPGGVEVSAPDKEIALTVFSIIHGNEWAGVGALNDFLDHLVLGVVKVPFSMVVALGNPWAALNNVRFIEKDLNRSFGNLSGRSKEQQRAAELSQILDQTAYLLDIHQCREPTAQPFFIFPYQKASKDWAAEVAPQIPVVTHWGGSYSTEGMCTDEYTNSQGGTGITIELGQNGFHPYHMAAGLRVILGAVSSVHARLQGRKVERLMPSTSDCFTWNAVVPFPAGKLVGMDEGWSNFQPVSAGQRLGEADGESIVAPKDGWVLFPQIRRTDGGPRPAELCRIMRKIESHELPGHGA